MLFDVLPRRKSRRCGSSSSSASRTSERGRQLELGLAASRPATLKQTTADLRQTWNSTEPSILRRGDVDDARRFTDIVVQLEGANRPAEPVSRQHETVYLGYYGYPYYWGGSGLWGMGAYPGDLTTAGAIEATDQRGASFDLFFVNRSRIDALKGMVGGLGRWIVKRRVRSGLRDTLRLTKHRLEEGYRAGPAAAK